MGFKTCSSLCKWNLEQPVGKLHVYVSPQKNLIFYENLYLFYELANLYEVNCTKTYDN